MIIIYEIDLIKFFIRYAILDKNLNTRIFSRFDVLCIFLKDDNNLISSIILLIAFNID